MRILAIFAALLLPAQTVPQPAQSLPRLAQSLPRLAQSLPQPAQTLPHPFDREGATKVLENDRVIVWDVSWLQRAYPTHRHVYDYASGYYRHAAYTRGARG